MKAKKNPLTGWELLEQQWRNQLEQQQEALPDPLWDKLEQRLDAQENKKKGGFLSFSTLRWAAAASVVLLLGMFWMQQNTALETAPVLAQKEVPTQKSTNRFTGTEQKVVQDKLEATALKKVEFASAKVKAKKAIEGPVTLPLQIETKVENSVGAIREVQIDVARVPERVQEAKPELVAKPTEPMPAEELFVIVDVEPVKKEKGIKKVLGFIQKVKAGKLFDLSTKQREGKLNDEIHQVVYKYQEKEEKIKTMLSL